MGFSQDVLSQKDSLRLDSIMKEFYMMFASFDTMNLYCKHLGINDLALRGKFTDVFKSKKIWNKFIKKNGEYIFIDAPETNWYDRDLGPGKTDKNYPTSNAVMVDSTVIRYYNTKIKGFSYDSLVYDIIEDRRFGDTAEDYDFYKDGKLVKSFIIGWEWETITTILEYNIPDRK